MSDTDFDYGYGEVDEVARETSGGGKYLNLNTDGKAHRLRIVSQPRYCYRHYLQETKKYMAHIDPKEKCEFCRAGIKKDAQWGWIVIDRKENYPDDPSAKDTVKYWKDTQSPAFLIRDISKLLDRQKKPVWGNPITYDLIIRKKKKDKAFGYDWDIQPDPDHAEPLTDAEKQLVAEAHLDLEREMSFSKESEHVGNYGKANMETAPEVNPDDIPDNLGSGSDTVTEDDIPF